MPPVTFSLTTTTNQLVLSCSFDVVLHCVRAPNQPTSQHEGINWAAEFKCIHVHGTVNKGESVEQKKKKKKRMRKE